MMQLIYPRQDGSILVLPYSYFGKTGDDAANINQAFTELNSVPGTDYGGKFTGQWQVGRVRLAPYDYSLLQPVNKPGMADLIGSGKGTRLFPASGVGAITCHSPAGGPQGGLALPVMGSITDLLIDGRNGGSYGLDLGGGWGNKVRATIANFTATGAIGLHLNNATDPIGGEWTEKSRIDVDLLHCDTACLVENTSGDTTSGDSFEYNDLVLYMMAKAGQRGFVITNGAFMNGSSLRIRGNFPDQSGPVMSVFGGMSHMSLDVVAESGGGIKPPQTILFDTQHGIKTCVGILAFQFANSSWTPSNVQAGQLTFGGIIDGDSNLIAANQRPKGWI